MELVAADRTLVYRISDFDVADVYSFTLRPTNDTSLAIQFFWNGGGGGHGRISVKMEAAKSAKSFARFSQGSVSEGGSDVDDQLSQTTPPFLLSRETFSALKAGKEVSFDFPEPGGILKSDGAVSAFRLPTTSIEVNAIKASSDELELVVLDDPKWPIVLSAKFSDDCEIRLIGLTLNEEVAS